VQCPAVGYQYSQFELHHLSERLHAHPGLLQLSAQLPTLHDQVKQPFMLSASRDMGLLGATERSRTRRPYVGVSPRYRLGKKVISCHLGLRWGRDDTLEVYEPTSCKIRF
jgi:hypothetical protein